MAAMAARTATRTLSIVVMMLSISDRLIME
jgi:hypothetical protein